MAKLGRYALCWAEKPPMGAMSPGARGEWTDYNDAAALIAKLRTALAEAVEDIEDEWGTNRGPEDEMGQQIARHRALIAEAEGIEPDKGG